MKDMIAVVKFGLLYFSLVFVFAFGMGTIRVFWVVPKIGARWAELLEMPFMIAVSFAAAYFVVGKAKFSSGVSNLGIGFFGLFFMIAIELLLIWGLRKITFEEYWNSLDPIAGPAFGVALFLFLFFPWMVYEMQSRKLGTKH